MFKACFSWVSCKFHTFAIGTQGSSPTSFSPSRSAGVPIVPIGNERARSKPGDSIENLTSLLFDDKNPISFIADENEDKGKMMLLFVGGIGFFKQSNIVKSFPIRCHLKN